MEEKKKKRCARKTDKFVRISATRKTSKHSYTSKNYKICRNIQFFVYLESKCGFDDFENLKAERDQTKYEMELENEEETKRNIVIENYECEILNVTTSADQHKSSKQCREPKLYHESQIQLKVYSGTSSRRRSSCQTCR